MGSISLKIESKNNLSTAKNRRVLEPSWIHNQTIKIRKLVKKFYIPSISLTLYGEDLMGITTADNFTSNSKTNEELHERRVLRPKLTRNF